MNYNHMKLQLFFRFSKKERIFINVVKDGMKMIARHI